MSGLLCTTMMVMAVPAKPGIMRLTQPDGSVVEATIVGDEHFHYYETPAGEILLRDNTGTLRPAVLSTDGTLEARGMITGKATPAAERSLIFKAIAEQSEKNADRQPSRVAPNPIQPKFPTTGTVTGLVLGFCFTELQYLSDQI